MYSRSVPSYSDSDEDELPYNDSLDANDPNNEFDEEIVRA